MGMIIVIAMVAKNGILLLDADQKFRDLGFTAEDAILQASQRRLRPHCDDSPGDPRGMLPLSFAIGAGSQMLQPLAIAVIGGVVLSMVLSLIITPAVHFFVGRDVSKSAAEFETVAAYGIPTNSFSGLNPGHGRFSRCCRWRCSAPLARAETVRRRSGARSL